jgi:hypothetical protein
LDWWLNFGAFCVLVVILVFRVKDICVFSGIFVTLVIGLAGSKAAYRRIGKYYKTTGQYWKERKRRSNVLRLLEKENLNSKAGSSTIRRQ